MKTFITLTISLLMLLAFFSCKKDIVEPDVSIPDPSDTTLQRSFKLVFTNLKGQWNGTEKLIANVTIENPKTPEKPTQLTTPVLFESQYGTPVVKLPKGAYQIQRLIINDDAGATRFATPIAGSMKASQISKPLSILLVLDEKTDKEVAMEVLPITNGDTPQNFGYPTGSFGKSPDDPQPPMDKRVFIRFNIKVGEILYDSIPAQLIVKSWDTKEEMDYKIHYLAAGTQAIYLSAKAVRFQLSVSKWGTNSELVLTQTAVQENAIYNISATVASKHLRSVTEAKIEGGTTRPQTKTDFEYHANGEIKQRMVWGKKADLSTYLMQKDIFSYTNGNITAIRSYNEDNILLQTLTARYNAEGKVIALEDTRGLNKITVTSSYLPLDVNPTDSRDYRIDAQYQFENGKYTDYYSKSMHNGKVLHDIYVSHNGSREEGTYDYDSNVNPYAHLRIPDLLFTQYTKHNLVFPRKIRTGARPQNEPYDYKYTYDAQGYPKELLTKYRSTETRVDTYTMRTIFTY